jgi:hypothetical protein
MKKRMKHEEEGKGLEEKKEQRKGKKKERSRM